MEQQAPPPINPSQLPPAKRSWSKTIGIITLIFGILGILGALVSPFTMFVTKAAMKGLVTQGADSNAVDGYLDKLASNTILSAICLAGLGILLALGGYFLLKKKPLGSPILQVWAVLKIVLGGLLTFRNMELTKMQLQIQNSVTAMDESAAAITESITSIVMVVAMGAGMLWLIALPVFLLVWLNRRKIKAEVGEW